MSFFGDLVSTVFERRYRGTSQSDDRSIEELCDALLGSHGEVSGSTLARLILDRFARMDTVEKLAFFRHLTHDLTIDPEAVTGALAAYQETPNRKTYRTFASAVEPRRQELARRLNQVPGATARLVAMRQDLLELLPKHPDLESLDVDFRHLFASWFNRGFLVLRPINWDSPARILEKIIRYEAVHAIDTWEDLRLRLAPPDRRCFGFFHPVMPDEPLIFVEVALTKGVPSSVQTLLADGREVIPETDADTAVFYSISNCQAGLAGISFGNSLIKQVVADLSRDHPALKTFVTLSPIPRLCDWASATDFSGAEPDTLAAHYLLEAKRNDGLPYDPVARFHLGNGARVHAVHANADISVNGQEQSFGTMVNYLYDLSQISQNHEKFVGDKIIAASPEVRALSARLQAKPSDTRP